MFSAVHPITDITKILRYVRFVPDADITMGKLVCTPRTMLMRLSPRIPKEAAFIKALRQL